MSKDVEKLEAKLANPRFCANAPAEIISKVKETLATACVKRDEVVASQERLAGLKRGNA